MGGIEMELHREKKRRIKRRRAFVVFSLTKERWGGDPAERGEARK